MAGRNWNPASNETEDRRHTPLTHLTNTIVVGTYDQEQETHVGRRSNDRDAINGTLVTTILNNDRHLIYLYLSTWTFPGR